MISFIRHWRVNLCPISLSKYSVDERFGVLFGSPKHLEIPKRQQHPVACFSEYHLPGAYDHTSGNLRPSSLSTYSVDDAFDVLCVSSKRLSFEISCSSQSTYKEMFGVCETCPYTDLPLTTASSENHQLGVQAYRSENLRLNSRNTNVVPHRAYFGILYRSPKRLAFWLFWVFECSMYKPFGVSIR